MSSARAALLVGCTLALGACGGGDDDGADPAPAPAPEPEFGSIAFSDLGLCKPLPVKPEYRCGSIEVPLERGDASYGTTEIGFAVLRRRDRSSPADGAFFMVEGGPGYASTGTGSSFAALMGPLLEHHDMVLVDQRGQGTSEQYDCPDLQAGLGPDFVALADCARRLGERFISYRTSAAADDIDAVREALGYQQIALYGDSYGTFLGQSYAYRHGDRLEAMVLDSAYPAFGEDPWYPSLPRTGIRALQTTCDRSPDCSGDAIARLEHALEVLREKARPGTDLLNALIAAAYGPPDTYLKINLAVSDLIDGDLTRYKRLVTPAQAGVQNGDRFQRAGEYVVGCNDYPMIWDKAASEAERRVQFEQAMRNYPADAFEPFTTREVALAEETSYLECLTWPAPTEIYEPAVDPETQEPTDAPVLVVSGEFDDLTTPFEGKTVAGFFPDSEQFVAPNAGHVDALYYPHRPAARKIREFLARELQIKAG